MSGEPTNIGETMIINGAIFENSRKKEGDNQPDLDIRLEVDGVKYRAGAWKRKSKDKGTVFYSIYADTEKQKAYEKADPSDEVPF